MKKLLTIFLIFFSCLSNIQAQVQHLSLDTYDNQREITATGSITFTNGFTVPAGTSFSAYITPPGGNCQQSLYTTNRNFNYIITHNVRRPGIVNPSDSTNLVCQVNTVIDYMDGQGRSVGSIAVKGSPSLASVFQLKDYNDLGLEKTQYLPYTKSGEFGFLRPNVTDLSSFYTNQVNVVHTPYPFSETVYEPSPLRRLEEQGAPGDYWQLGTSSSPNKGHTITYVEDNHKREALYKVAIDNVTGARTLTRKDNNELYPIDALTRVVTRDENNNNSYNYAGTSLECKDREGRVVLKRTYNQNGAVVDTLSTYYVYDDFGNLSFVLPPKAEPDKNVAIPQTTLDNLCYQYRYDGRRRLTAKKLPGKGWEYMVYNKRDQLILTQDAEQRNKAPQEWAAVKYDVMGREIIKGIYLHPGSTAGTDNLNTVQNLANAVNVYWEGKVTTGNGYTNSAFPTALTTTLSINYYDDYNFPGGNPYPYTEGGE
ncbi:DUF6443 domain-containing protein [Pedobacter ginsengisoli]|nr:DUF6443 domain-containing protein [Pedobacter ginsengisoli]